jgi:putative transposase
MTQKRSPFRYFKTSPEIIRLTVMMYIRFPLSLRNVEDLLHERGVEVSHETVRYWWNRFGPMFAAEIRKRPVQGMRSSRSRWHLDEMFVKINGKHHCLWRAIDHEGEVLESFFTVTRDKAAALKFLRKSMKRHGRPVDVVTDRLRCYGAALKEMGRGDDREMGRWTNNRAENSHLPFRSSQPLQPGTQPLLPLDLQAEPCRRPRRAARPFRGPKGQLACPCGDRVALV